MEIFKAIVMKHVIRTFTLATAHNPAMFRTDAAATVTYYDDR